jgi:predicted RNase H-like HicB family nuclease
MRRIVLYVDEDGWWVATCPSLPGCNTQGATRDEVLENIKEAIALYIDVLQEE